MRFPNAYKGVKKIFSAEIFMIAGSVILLVGIVFALVLSVMTVNTTITYPEPVVAAVALITAVGMLVGGGLAVAALIVHIIGVYQAKKDENSFGTALIFLFISIAAAVLSSTIRVEVVSDIANTVRNICDICAIIYIIGGVRELARQLGNEKMVNSANRAHSIILWVYGLLIIAQVVAIVFDFLPMMVTAAGILGIIAAVLNVVAYVYYLIFLGKAAKMLKK